MRLNSPSLLEKILKITFPPVVHLSFTGWKKLPPFVTQSSLESPKIKFKTQFSKEATDTLENEITVE